MPPDVLAEPHELAAWAARALDAARRYGHGGCRRAAKTPLPPGHGPRA